MATNGTNGDALHNDGGSEKGQRSDDAPLHSRSPLRSMHFDATKLASLGPEVEVSPEDVLYGPHGLKFPVLALLVNRHLGPVRHALAQRTVAGGMTVLYAPGDRPEEEQPATSKNQPATSKDQPAN
ncbi:MAG: hypothetical protein CL927_10360 [Deltaproteobacteria bacterium]|nr:hypothetical protein [Deltaproteobacteria bacterium]HCH64802.1 hypothetical protein [Deltaproteobacteria bacterium]